MIEPLLDHIIRVEGGYVNDPDDPGGETKYGISKRSYPHLDIYYLTEEEAREIYKRDFIEPFLPLIDDPKLLCLVVDAAVNHGLSRAMEWLEKYPTFDEFMAQRIKFYTSLQSFDNFGRGWMNRLMHIYKATGVFHNVATLIDNRPLHIRVKAAVNKEQGVVKFRVRSKVGGKGLKLDIS